MTDSQDIPLRDQEIRNNHDYLESLLDRAEEAISNASPESTLDILSQAAEWAWNNGCGTLCNKRMESLCSRLSAQIPLDSLSAAGEPAPASIVILMSSIHAAGGHSLLAQRWMSMDTEHVFTLVLTRQQAYPVPEALNLLIDSGRLNIKRLDEGNSSRLEMIRQIRRHALQARRIVILIHPDDPLPSVALAGLDRQPPTLFVDHAAHTFWLGAEVSHVVTPLLKINARICTERRGIPENRLSPIPLPLSENTGARSSRNVQLEALGIPASATVMLSSGWAYKYRPILGEYTLQELVAPVMLENPGVHLIVAGPSPDEKSWAELSCSAPGRIHLLGIVNEQRLKELLGACDLYLDAAPFPSGLAMADAVLAGIPVLKYASQAMRDCGFSQDSDALAPTDYLFTTAEDYRNALRDRLHQPELRQTLASRMREAVLASSSPEVFLQATREAWQRAEAVDTQIRIDADTAKFRITLLDRLLLELSDNHEHSPSSRTCNQASLVRALAFHLPQFHAIPENDLWWGKGFTEWDNVRKGEALFDAHYQPHVPSELGYYDLSQIATLARQADLAREYGLAGFCFYYYWFDGKRLLEKPVDTLLRHKEVQLPFCLCWANENWTRRWDGGESEMLMKQSYATGLNEEFAADLVPYFRDARYIRIQDKPVLLIYRTDIIPELRQTIRQWRQAWRTLGIGEVYLICIESFTLTDPVANGFDAACEFFPHQIDFSGITPFPFPQNLRDKEARIGSYEKLASQISARSAPGYKRFRGVVPSWDNSARRRKGGATLFTGATPERYEEWLRTSLRKTLLEFDGDERLLFINAWNEWGEGCHLEPDECHGRAYLEATRRALTDIPEIDLQFERRMKQYHNWFSAFERGAVAPIDEQQIYTGFLAVIDATQGHEAERDATLSSLEAFRKHGGKVVVASPVRPPQTDVAWHQSDHLDLASLRRLPECGSGAWLGILKAGDLLSASEMPGIVQCAQAHPEAVLIYSDHDLVDRQFRRHSSNLKPDFDRDLLLSTDYIGRSIWLRTEQLLSLEFQPQETVQASIYALLLELSREQIVHHHGIAFHLRETPNTGLNTEARKSIIEKHFSKHAIQASIQPGLAPDSIRIIYDHASRPRVSIIIPTRNQQGLLSRCIESLTQKTTYPDYELIIVDNNSDEPDAQAYIEGIRNLGLEQIRILSFPHPFNFSAINNLAAREARGEYLILLNNDTAIIKGDWIENLLNHAMRPEVGVTGAKLLYPDGRIQHAGVVLGLRGPAEHPFIGSPLSAPGYNQRLLLDQQYSAVTAACMMVRKSVFEAAGGMDEALFKVSYNDIDLCLKIRSLGYNVVWTPHAVVMHVANVSQKSVDMASTEAKQKRFQAEQLAMYRKWMPELAHDPHYNTLLSLAGNGFELEANPLFARTPAGLPKFYALCADRFGSGLYRCTAPASALIDAGLAAGAVGHSYMETVNVVKADPSVIVFQRQITDTQIGHIQNYREFTRAKLVFELDDYLPNLPVASLHKSASPKDVTRNMRRAMDLCDRVVVSTEALRHALSKWHKDIVVLPNYLPPSIWKGFPQHPAARLDRRPRVGWAGGVGHAGDLRLIVDIVKAFSQTVDWVFFGMIPPGCEQHIKEFHQGVSITDYPECLAALDLDLALAPLEDNQFNECKSNLRLLEYGICGYPVIASDCTAYRSGLPVTLVKNRFRDWQAAITEKLADRAALHAEGVHLQDSVRSGWMLEHDNLLRWRSGWLLG